MAAEEETPRRQMAGVAVWEAAVLVDRQEETEASAVVGAEAAGKAVLVASVGVGAALLAPTLALAMVELLAAAGAPLLRG